MKRNKKFALSYAPPLLLESSYRDNEYLYQAVTIANT